MAENDKSKSTSKPAEKKAARERALFSAASPVLLDGIAYAAGEEIVLTRDLHAELAAAGVVAATWDEGAEAPEKT